MQNWSMVCTPVIVSQLTISVPHDGLIKEDLSSFWEERKIGYKGRDKHVWPLVNDILKSFATQAVRGLMARAFVDYNRAWPIGINYYPKTQAEVHTALDDTRLVDAYNYYHSCIENLVTSSIETWGKKSVLHVDLHGFGKQPPYAPPGGYDLILGTGNRTTIPHKKVDILFAEFMRAKGYQVFLPADFSVGPEEDYYSADFTTRHYSEKFNINVLQIEIAQKFRTRDNVAMGKKLSSDFVEFFETHLLIQI